MHARSQTSARCHPRASTSTMEASAKGLRLKDWLAYAAKHNLFITQKELVELPLGKRLELAVQLGGGPRTKVRTRGFIDATEYWAGNKESFVKEGKENALGPTGKCFGYAANLTAPGAVPDGAGPFYPNADGLALVGSNGSASMRWSVLQIMPPIWE